MDPFINETTQRERFPGVVFHGEGVLRRRAHIAGSGFDVWQLCETLENYGSDDLVVADFPKVSATHCRLARAYRSAYPDEIDEFIADNRRPLEDREALYPFVDWRAGRTT